MTLHVVDTDTGEVVDRAPAVRAPGPMTVVDVAAQCRSVEVWAERKGAGNTVWRATGDGCSLIAAMNTTTEGTP